MNDDCIRGKAYAVVVCQGLVEVLCRVTLATLCLESVAVSTMKCCGDIFPNAEVIL